MKSLSKDKICNCLEVMLGLLIILQAVKKGGFYISDMNYIFVAVLSVTLVYIVIKMIDKSFKLDLGSFFIFLLFVAYILPVIFKKCVDVESGIWEAFKYLELLCIYIVGINSKNIKVFEVIIIVLGTVIGLFGIDQIAGRYLEDFLKILNSGYLSSYLERLSSTIQYANTAGVIMMTAYFIAIKNLFYFFEKLKEDYKLSNIYKCKYLFYASSFLLVTCILTQSRFILLLIIIGNILLVLSNTVKKNRLIYVLVSIIMFVISFITSSIIDIFMYNDYMYIYLVTALFIVLMAVIFNILLSKVIMNVKIWYKLEIGKKIISKKGKIIVFGIIAIYIILALNITGSITLDANSKDLTFTKKIDLNGENSLQDIEIKVNKDENSKFEIEMYELKKDNVEKLLATFSDYSSEDGVYKKSFMPEEKSKSIILNFKVKEGKINIDLIKYNGINQKLGYILLPTGLTYRLNEELINSTSSIVRREYIKDSFKILKTSPIIGRGGEAFRYLYKEVQTGHYISTEAHSSFMQIMIESGIIGEIFILAFCVYVFAKGKNKEYRVIFLIFIIHSLFDLNFSYTISVMVFGIISAFLIKNHEN